MTVLTFCGLLFINPVGQHLNLHTHAWWDDRTLIPRLRSYHLYILIVAFLGFVAVFILNMQHGGFNLLWTAAAMFAMVVANTWNSTFIPMLNQLGFRASAVIWGVVTTATALIASLMLTHWMPSASAWFLGQFVGMATGAYFAKRILYQQAEIKKGFESRLPLLNRAVVLTYCLPLAIATGLMWLQLSGYRFLIDRYWGLEQLALLAVGIQLSGQILAVAEALAMQFLYPYFFRRVTNYQDADSVASAYSDLLNTLIPVYLVLTAVLLLSAPYLLRVLVSEQYLAASRLVMLGALIDMCRMVGNLLSNAAHVKRQTKYLSYPYAAGATLSLLAICLVGEFQLAIEWAAYGLLLGGAAMLLAMGFVMYRQVPFKLDYQRHAIACGLLLLMFAMRDEMPLLSGLLPNFGMLVLIGILSCAFVFVSLKGNPATKRLLEVQLRKS